MTISGVGSRSLVKRPCGQLGMPTIRCWWQLHCWRATLRVWATLSPVDGLTARGDQTVVGICTVEGTWGAAGGDLPASQHKQVPSGAGCIGDPAKRWAPPSSPASCRRHIAFEENSTESDTSVGEVPPWPRLRRCPTGVSQWKETLGLHPLLTLILNISWVGVHPSREQKEEGTPARSTVWTSPWGPL